MRWLGAAVAITVAGTAGACLMLVDFHESTCTSSVDCSSGQSCVNGGCRAGEKCASLFDCPSLEDCVNGTCQLRPCSADSQCTSPNYIGGICIAELDGEASYCRPSSYCANDAACPAGARCVDSACHGAACTAEGDCFPYACSNGECTFQCDLDRECHPDGMCLSHQCINPSCTASTEAQCLGYTCDVAISRCNNTCGTTFSLDGGNVPYGCVSGYVCASGGCTRKCVSRDDPLCAGNSCDVTTGICHSSCSATSDCAAGYYCRTSTCVKGTCTTNADCAGYQCVNGKCSTACGTDADCAAGYRCVASACTTGT